MDYAVKVDNLKKCYGNKEVLSDLSLQVKKGEVFGLLGANGAGKTTTLECIEGLKTYSSGSIDIKGSFGVQLQNASFPHNITAIEAIMLFCTWKKVKGAEQLILDFGIKSFEKTLYQKLSTGQKRKLHLVIALLGDPDIIFLDEPTAGLDIEGKMTIHKYLKQLKNQGKTIILSSHDLAEIEELCDTIAIVADGKIAFCGSPYELINYNNENSCKLMIKTSNNSNGIWKQMNIKEDEGYLIFECDEIQDLLFEISTICKNHDLSITDIVVKKQGIADKFIQVSKGE